MELDALRSRWVDERPTYESLALLVKGQLEAEARRRGLKCEVKARAKDVASLLKKAIRKAYSDPWNEIEDKAGARIIVTYEVELPLLQDVVTSLFRIIHWKDKRTALEPAQLGYLGIHYQVALTEQQIAASPTEFADLTCEIQLHTRAQSLWADVEHQLNYKAAMPTAPDIERRLYRLMSLVEIFDETAVSCRAAIMERPGYEEHALLDHLERHYLAFNAPRFDRQLSLDVIQLLKGLYTTEQLSNFQAVLDGFVGEHRSKVQEIFDAYRESSRHLLLTQPECLLLFERLHNDRFRLQEAWNGRFPPELLSAVADVWGKPLHAVE